MMCYKFSNDLLQLHLTLRNVFYSFNYMVTKEKLHKTYLRYLRKYK